jgi:hypothetical protein
LFPGDEVCGTSEILDIKQFAKKLSSRRRMRCRISAPSIASFCTAKT